MNNVALIDEIWKPVCGYEGLYEVSNFGRVKSLKGWNGKHYIEREKILKQGFTTTGYKRVDLVKNKQRKTLKVHRLVITAFQGEDKERQIVNHIDGNPINNKLENLEWCTQKENIEHALRTGLKKRNTIDKSELEHEYCELRLPSEEIARRHNCTKPTVYKHLRAYGITRKKSKYGIEIDTLKEQFQRGMSNKELSRLYGCSGNLIARRRYQYNHNLI